MPEKFEFKFKVAEELAAALPAVRAAGEVTAVIHENEPDERKGYWAEVPALPGCFSMGDTLEEMKANIREAAELWLESTKDGEEKEKSPRRPESERATETAASA